MKRVLQIPSLSIRSVRVEGDLDLPSAGPHRAEGAEFVVDGGLGVFGAEPFSPGERVERKPIDAAQFGECFLCGGLFATGACRCNDGPPSCGK